MNYLEICSQEQNAQGVSSLLRYNSSRHRQLMTASEHALQDATESPVPRQSRIASTILGDSQKYREWELRHANLLLPVAEQRARKRQVVALRNAEIELVHRRALFTYLQTHELRDDQRQRLFRMFHSTLDYNQAVLNEHRHYMLAVSSQISTDYIIDVMRDVSSDRLLQQYEKTFARYFEMKCYVASAKDSHCIQLISSSLRDVKGQLLRIRRRIETEVPVVDRADFRQLELLARSSRYEMRNYLYV